MREFVPPDFMRRYQSQTAQRRPVNEQVDEQEIQIGINREILPECW